VIRYIRNTWAVLEEKEKRQFLLLVVLDIVISFLDIVSLVLLLFIIRFYVEPGAVTSFLPGWLSDRNSLALIIVFFLAFGIKNMFGYFINRVHYRFIGAVALRLSARNLSNYQHSDYAEFVNTDSSAFIRRIAFRPFEFSQYILAGIQQIITQVCLILITIVAILLFKAKLFVWLLIILLPPMVVVFYFIKLKLSTARQKIQSSNERSFQHLLDALKGYVESNIYNRNEFFLQRYMKSRAVFGQNLFDSLSLQSLPGRVIEIFAVLGLLALIAIAKWSANDASAFITIGAFMAAAYKIIPGMVKIINTAGQMKAYEFSPDELNVKTAEGRKELKRVPIQTVQLKDVHFNYGERPVLTDLSLCMRKGEFVGITGESGIGKTTFFNLLLGFLQPKTGEVSINEVTCNNDEIQNFWPSIAYVRQQSFFIYDSILRNITFQEEGYDEEKLKYALAISGLDALVKTFPEGLNKIITENGKNISGGQQQRIALARALYKNGDLILLDEPFNELDEATTNAWIGHFRKMAEDGKIVVLITHDKKSLAHCHKIISLDGKG
jgi:ABC-type bacteriocin/lantibiotic exporter with double-glycine peptidase domain